MNTFIFKTTAYWNIGYL